MRDDPDLLQQHRQPGGQHCDGGDKVKDQVAGLELGQMFVLCGSLALRTHISNIAIFAHQDPRMEVTSGAREVEATDTTRLESIISFQQIRSSMKLHDKIQQR